MRFLFTACLFVPFVLLGLGHLGFVHTAFDSIAVFRRLFWFAALVSLLIWLIRKQYKFSLIGGVYCCFLALTLWPVYFNTGSVESQTFGVYQKNLWFRNATPQILVDDIIQSRAQVVTLQEVSKKNLLFMEMLESDYQSAHHCTYATVGGVAVLSKYPVIEGSKGCLDGAAFFRVQSPFGPLWVVSVHLHWPWPHKQQEQIEEILPELKLLDGVKVVGGDFNMVPWSHRFAEIEETLDVRLINGVHRSFDLKGVMKLPIDHVLFSNSQNRGTGQIRGELGSDHFGVLATLPM